MIESTNGTGQYRIIIRGDCRRLLASLIDNVQVTSARCGDTCLVARVRDDPEFWGLMEQVRDLALHVVSVQELGPGPRPAGVSAVADGQRARG